MRKYLPKASLLLLIPLTGLSQPQNFYNVDYGLKLGVSNYIGDIGGYDKKAQPFVLDMKMQETRWSLGSYLRYRLGKPYMGRDPWSIEAQLNYIRISGADSLTAKFAPRKLRGISFRNDIVQFNSMVEWIFLENPDIGHKNTHKKDINMYLGTGISIFYQDPYAYNPNHYFGLPLGLTCMA